MPLKKKAAQKVPIMFAKGDGGIADTYAMLERLERLDPVPQRERKRTPMFRRAKRALAPREFLKGVHDFARAAGQNPKKFSKH